MVPEIKTQWMADLRSGENKQGYGWLRQYNEDTEEWELCCLGVLCEQAVRAGIVRCWEDGRITRYMPADAPDGELPSEASVLPSVVVTWAGLDQRDPEVEIDEGDEDGHSHVSLSGLNDDGEHTFADIADVIDQEL